MMHTTRREDISLVIVCFILSFVLGLGSKQVERKNTGCGQTHMFRSANLQEINIVQGKQLNYSFQICPQEENK